MEISMMISVALLLMINVTDSITTSIVGPSLIFYVTEMGGTKEQYGMIMSSSYLSGILFMSFYGAWVDGNGNKYRAPYAASFALGMAGSLVYFLAAIIPPGRVAIGAILVGRFVTGIGSSGRTLAYSWVATGVPRDKQRTVLTMLSMTRTLGLIMGPLLNALIAKVDAELVIASVIIPITPNNFPGLMLFVGECLLLASMYKFLDDPPAKTKDLSSSKEHPSASLKVILNAVTSFDLALPMMILFTLMCNYTFYTVAIPPVGSTAFGWSTVQIANVLAAQAIVLFVSMNGSMALSMMTEIPDSVMIIGGNIFFVVGGAMTYFSWKVGAATWQFVMPVMLITLAYPSMGPANRSSFTMALHRHPELENSIGIMQSIFSQMIMIGGFITPNLVTKYVLLSPGQIAFDSSSRVLSPWAWFIPISSLLMIALTVYQEVKPDKIEVEEEETPETETFALLAGKTVSNIRRRSSVITIDQSLSARYEINRRASVEAFGMMNPCETRDEINLHEKLLRDKREWEEILELDEEMD
ncbi:hypothetical protein ACHAW5_008981 [Stephanodiscus triporus]|uniref:Major facilitator superfamily (MFS) profile domain-containing protein n=1 Tax=Stephanodiscus triporus TaxID=2934178 RepID=A0ABD3PIA4_9STRA